MKKTLLARGVLTSCITLSGAATAADVNINGFASFAGGKAISQGKDLAGNKNGYKIDPTHHTSPNAAYDDDISFNPDSNFGIQFSSDLGEGLSVTAQITGKGSNDYEAEVEWAYVTYEATDSLTLQGGRMRLPLYYYSDFLDVGYAYHWLRAPVDVYAEGISIYEGIAIRHETSLGAWDLSTSLHGGAGSNDDAPAGDTDIEDYVGLVVNAQYDWLKLRGSVHSTDTYTDDTVTTDEDPAEIMFSSLGAFANIENWFFGAEMTRLESTDDDFVLVQNVLAGDDDAYLKERNAYMVTASYRMGKFTPHVTYTERTLEFGEQQAGSAFGGASIVGKELANESWIVGVRWDFHPAAALKLEYTDRSTESDDEVVAVFGKNQDVSSVAFGIDVIF